MSNQENIALSEQTPLKTDTDAPAPGAESTAEGGPAEAGKKKQWFFTKKTKTAKPASEGAETNNDNNKEAEGGEHAAPACKKPRWWQRKPCAPGAQSDNPCMSVGINMVQRDDHQLQTGIDLGFEDIYGEPDNAHSIDAIWRINHSIFTAVRCFFYKVFSLIIALPLAVVFGILFALVSALSVYVIVPLGRLLSIPAWWIFKVWTFVVGAVFDPVFTSIGRICSNVRISRYGISSDPTGVLSA